MKIRILKAGKPTFWYASKIGEIFEAHGVLDSDGDFRVDDCRDGTRSAGYVEQRDCEIVEEAEVIEPANANVTVLKDELGLQREYREVKRNANVGERIKVVEERYGLHIGGVYEVKDSDHLWGGEYRDGTGVTLTNGSPLYHRKYVVLEKTDIVHVGGERFREVIRKPSIGERVVIVENTSHHYFLLGSTTIIQELGRYRVRGEDEQNGWMSPRDYRVLEPLAPAQQTQASEQQAQIDGLVETVANLARRLSKAETQLRVACEDIVLIEDGVSEELRKLTDRVAELERGQAPTTKACEPVVSKTSARDEIIEKAKADVAELVERARTGLDTPLTKSVGHVDVRFEVNREKKKVVALAGLRYCGGHVVARGIAKCSPNDCFNVHIGIAIALRRALGLDIPQEYVSAPQPTEAKIGDYVEYKGFVAKVEPPYSITERFYHYEKGDCAVGSVVANNGRIIDDSRDGRYGEVYSA